MHQAHLLEGKQAGAQDACCGGSTCIMAQGREPPIRCTRVMSHAMRCRTTLTNENQWIAFTGLHYVICGLAVAEVLAAKLLAHSVYLSDC